MATQGASPTRPLVLTVHGVCPNRGWQGVAKHVLEPHFKCEPIEYHEYDCVRGGAIKAVIHPFFLIVALAIAGMAAVQGLGLIAWLIAAAFFGFGVVLATILRHRCTDRIKTQISERSSGAYTTQVIAHSLGTYLAGNAMTRFDVDVDKVVLVGSVLPRWFDWQQVTSQVLRDSSLPSGFAGASIRNELGKRDVVVWLTGLTKWLTRDMGSAGRNGFIGNADAVHTTTGPWQACPLCSGGQDAFVHNVPLEQYGHSDHFLGPGHALRLWLPFLWDYPPTEFRRWLKLCGGAAQCLHDRDQERYAVFTTALLDTEWTWTTRRNGGRRTLRQCLVELMTARRQQLPAAQQPDLNAAISEAMSAIVNSVRLASDSAYDTSVTDDNVRWRLNPRLALTYTVLDALES
jgi:pimeloyl-ACP methyl ester carboxylesterase